MNRRILPFSLVVCGAILAYACSSEDSTKDPVPNPVPEGGGTDTGPKPDEDGAVPDLDGGTDAPIPPNANPILGIGTPTEITSQANIYTEGPVWRTNALYFSTYGTTSTFLKLTLPNTPSPVRPLLTAGNYALGNAFDPKAPGTFVSIEITDGTPSGTLVRTPAAGGAGTAITLGFDAGGGTFDTPNDLVARKDGTLYVTDPGYQNPGTVNNHIWRISPAGETFETVVEGRPNGIAFSPDEKTLYVSFTDPPLPATKPTILKYVVAVNGTLGAAAKFADVTTTMQDSLDGLTTDSSGNVYAAVKNGVDVFKPDGTLWGHITTTKKVTGVALGGPDKKTLFMTCTTGLLQVNVKIAGTE
jgi:gluconolactonase